MSEMETWIESVVARVDDTPEQAAQFLAYTSGAYGDRFSDLAVVDQQADEIAAGADPEAVHEGLEELSDPTTRAQRVRERLYELVVAANVAPEAGEDEELPGVARGAAYAGEVEHGWRQNPDVAGKWTTEYENRDTLEARSASYEDGRVFDPDGVPMNGRWGWVVDAETGWLLFFDPNALILISPNGSEEATTLPAAGGWAGVVAKIKAGFRVRQYHHTSPVAGAAVGGAGEMVLADGWVTEITDQSGHYRPEAEYQYSALGHLEGEGVSFQRPAEWNEDGEVTGYREADVTLTGAGGARPTDKAGWLGEANADNPYYPTGDVSVSASQFAQTGGNEAQIRAKQGLNAEFEDTVAPDLRRDAEAQPAAAPAPAAPAPAAPTADNDDADARLSGPYDTSE